MNRVTVDAGALMRIYSIVNVDKCLKFLQTKLREPLSNIGSEDIVDGNLKLTMGLIWILILRFRIEAIALKDKRISTQPLTFPASTRDRETVAETMPHNGPTDSENIREFAGIAAAGGKAALLSWCQQILAPYVDIGIIPVVKNFSRDWQNGLAFLCLVHSFNSDLVPDLTDMSTRYANSKAYARQESIHLSKALSEYMAYQGRRKLSSPDVNPITAAIDKVSISSPPSSPRHSIRSSFSSISSGHTSPPASPLSGPSGLTHMHAKDPEIWRTTLSRAFDLAEEHMGVSQLLDVDDVAGVEVPDEMIIMTYVSEIYWVLRSRPFPSPTSFRDEADSSDLSLLPAPVHYERLIAQFQKLVGRLATWLALERECMLQVMEGLKSWPVSRLAEKPLPRISWTSSFVQALTDAWTNTGALKNIVNAQIAHIEKQLSPTSDEIVTGEIKEGPQIMHRIVNMYEELKRLRKEIAATGANPPDMTDLREKFRHTKARYHSLVKETCPLYVGALKIYITWIEDRAMHLERVQEELVGFDGQGGLRTESQRLIREVKLVAKDLHSVQAEDERLASRDFEDERRFHRRIAAMKKVVYEKLGGAAVQEWSSDPANTGADDDTVYGGLVDLGTRVEHELSLRVQVLRARVAELVLDLEKDYASGASTSGDFSLIPVFMIQKGRNLMDIANDEVLTFIATQLIPSFSANAQHVSATLDSVRKRRADEESREASLREAATGVTKAYCVQVTRTNDAIKRWRAELDRWTAEDESKQRDEYWISRAETWWKARQQEIRQCVEASTDRDLSISKLDQMWDGVVQAAKTGLTSRVMAESLFVSIPHQTIKNDAVALLERMSLFRSDILDRARGAVFERREGLVSQWESVATEIERVLILLGGEDNTIEQVDKALDAHLDLWVGLWERLSRMFNEDGPLQLTEIGKAMTNLITTAKKSDKDLSGYLADVNRNLRSADSDGIAFEETRWTPFQVRTEALLNGLVGLQDSDLKVRVNARYLTLKGTLEHTVANRKKTLSQSQARERLISETFTWLQEFILRLHQWLSDIDHACTELDKMDFDMSRLLAAMRTVIFNTAHGQTTGQEEALELHKSTWASLEEDMNIAITPLFKKVCSEEFPVDEEVPQRLIERKFALFQVRTRCVAKATDDINIKYSKLRDTAAFLKRLLPIEEQTGVYIREANNVASLLRKRLENERLLVQSLPHGLGNDVSVDTFTETLQQLDGRGIETSNAVATLARIRNSCVALLKPDQDFVPVRECIDKRWDEIQHLLEQLQDTVDKITYHVNTGIDVFKTVQQPGVKLLDACQEIRNAVSEVAVAAAREAGGAIEIMMSVRVLAERADTLVRSAERILADAIDVQVADDEKVAEFISSLRTAAKHAQQQTGEAGAEVAKAVVEDWEQGIVSKVESWCESLQSRLLAGSPDAEIDELYTKLANKYANLTETADTADVILQQLEVSTEAVLKTLNEWTSGKTHDADSSAIPMPEILQRRYIELRTRVEDLSGNVYGASTFLRLLEKFVGRAAIVEKTLQEMAKGISTATSEEAADVVDQELSTIERSTELSHLLGDLRAHSASSTLRADYQVVIPYCTDRFAKLLEDVQLLKRDLLQSRQTRNAATSYLNKLDEFKSWAVNHDASLAQIEETATANLGVLKPSNSLEHDILQENLMTTLNAIDGLSDRLTVASSELERYARSYDSITSQAQFVIEGCASDELLARQIQEAVISVREFWTTINERQTRCQQRITQQRHFIATAIKCCKKIIKGIAEARTKIADIDAVKPTLAEQAEVGLAALCDYVSDEIKRMQADCVQWQQAGSDWMDNVTQLATGQFGGDLEVTEALALTLCERIKREQVHLEQATQHRSDTLSQWSTAVTDFLTVAAEHDIFLEDTIRGLRNRLYGGKTNMSMSRQASRQTSRQSLRGSMLLGETLPTTRYLVVFGHDSADGQNLEEWSKEFNVLHERLHKTAPTQLSEFREITDKLYDMCHNIGGLIAEDVESGIRERWEGISERYKEAQRLAEEESLGIERAKKYQQWHGMMQRVEEEVNDLDAQLASVSESNFEQQLEEIGFRVAAVEGTITMFVKLTEQEKPLSSAMPEDLMTSDKRSSTLRKHRSLASLQVVSLAEQSNAATLKSRVDAVSTRLGQFAALVRERRDELTQSVKTKSIQEEVALLSSWCRNAIKALEESRNRLPPRPLLEQIGSFGLADTVQADLVDGVRRATALDLDYSQECTRAERLHGSLSPDQREALDSQLRIVERLLTAEKSRIEATKKLFGLDRAMLTIMNWISAAKEAVVEIEESQRQLLEKDQASHSEAESTADPLAATFADVTELEDRINSFEGTVAAFLTSAAALKEQFGNTSDVYDDEQILNAAQNSVDIRFKQVNSEWEMLLYNVGKLRGSSVDRRREIDFNETVDEIWEILEEVKNLLNGDAEDIADAEDMLDGRVLPALTEVREKVESSSRDARERKRFSAKSYALDERVRTLFEEIEGRGVPSDRSLAERRVARLVLEYERLHKEYSSCVQHSAGVAAAASAFLQGIPLPAGGEKIIPPTDSECETLALNLARQFDFHDAKVRSILARLAPATNAVGDASTHVNLTDRWEGIHAWQSNVRYQLLAQVRAKRTPKRSAIPVPSRSRSASASKPGTRKGSQIPPSPTTTASSGRSISPARLPATVRIYVPSPNHYMPLPNDPLDEAVAMVVNNHPSAIRVERAAEHGRYWFGESLRRLCFCRLVRNSVMVRIGGGWQELNNFLTEHTALEHRIPTIRSFLTDTDAGPIEGFETSEVYEVDTSHMGGNPYALAASQRPRKLVNALANVAARSYR
ncbi:hypothetical protein BC832DRAFT_411310 [Gaertneriomyces semiglobifer]|nr:hypothetical protein BC832DRAFT_411310 [Gaertneriomyces semiglobifer]